MTVLRDLFTFCWQVLNYPWVYGNFTFTLWDITKCSLFLGFTGFVCGKVIFFRRGD